MRIGLFDSGIGGLTVLKSFLKYHPNNEYIYYGDTLHLPYGEKTKEELYEYSKNIIENLLNKKVDIIIIACGTVSANLYDRLKEETSVPIYSVISELPKYLEEKKYKKTLVLATNASIKSHVFSQKIKNEVIEVACPKLVPIIESKNYNELDNDLDEYLKETDGIDSLVLGCTHYPIVKDQIKKKIKNNVDIIDLGEILAKNIKVTDSFNSVELIFSKETSVLKENIDDILNK
jgi:glutamate racemase